MVEIIPCWRQYHVRDETILEIDHAGDNTILEVNDIGGNTGSDETTLEKISR